jgi:hypothetical protein
VRHSSDSRVRRAQVVTVAAVVVIVATALALDAGVAWQPLDTSAFHEPPPCEFSDHLLWKHETSSAEGQQPGTTKLARSAFMTACPWSPGTLTVTLRGTIAAGIGTRAVLVQGPNRLLDVELRNETRTFTVDVPAAGQLLLAFVNDYYDPPEDRNLWVSGLEFTPRAP